MAQLAEAWLAAHPEGFEATYTGTLRPASEFATSLYNGGAAGSSSFGIRFARPIVATDTAATLQDALDFVCFERVELPGLDPPEGWRVTGDFPVSSFPDGEGGQTVKVTALEGGSRLRWTVEARLYCIHGVDQAAPPTPAGAPLPEGAYWSVRQDFRGTLHFDCEVAGLVATAPAAVEPEPEPADAAQPSAGEAFAGPCEAACGQCLFDMELPGSAHGCDLAVRVPGTGGDSVVRTAFVEGTGLDDHGDGATDLTARLPFEMPAFQQKTTTGDALLVVSLWAQFRPMVLSGSAHASDGLCCGAISPTFSHFSVYFFRRFRVRSESSVIIQLKTAGQRSERRM